MKSEADENQLGLWEKLNQIYGDKPSEAGGSSESPRLEVHSVPEEDSVESAHSADRSSGSAGDKDSVNLVCGKCDKTCIQPEGKFVETLCPLSGEERAAREDFQPEAAFKPVYNLEKINPACGRCLRNCKQSTEKLNLILCPGFEPIDSPQAESG